MSTIIARVGTFFRWPRRLPQPPVPAGREGGLPRRLGPLAPSLDGKIPALSAAEVARLVALGIRPMELAGRLRLVLPVGCSHDFTQTRAILRTGAARDQMEAAIQALIERGAHCDCAVFQAVGEPPRCALWHHL